MSIISQETPDSTKEITDTAQGNLVPLNGPRSNSSDPNSVQENSYNTTRLTSGITYSHPETLD